jgi:hypothetical protein
MMTTSHRNIAPWARTLCRAAVLSVVCAMSFGYATPSAFAQTAPDAVRLAEQYPWDASLAFNAALELVARGETGRAVAELERAQLLAPLDTDIFDARQTILQHTRREHADRVIAREFTAGEPSSIVWWRLFQAIPVNLQMGLLALASWLLFGGLIVRRRTIGLVRDSALVAVIGGVLLSLLAGFVAGGRLWTEHAVSPAVVVANDPLCREAPDELARTRTHPNLYPGVMCVVRSERDQWLELELPGGDRVWVNDEVVWRPDNSPGSR